MWQHPQAEALDCIGLHKHLGRRFLTAHMEGTLLEQSLLLFIVWQHKRGLEDYLSHCPRTGKAIELQRTYLMCLNGLSYRLKEDHHPGENPGCQAKPYDTLEDISYSKALEHSKVMPKGPQKD